MLDKIKSILKIEKRLNETKRKVRNAKPDFDLSNLNMEICAVKADIATAKEALDKYYKSNKK